MNRPKRLGTSFEVAVVQFLRDHVFPLAERRTAEGSHDRGDIGGTPYVFECKNLKTLDLAGGMKELDREIANANAAQGFLIVKRRNKSVGDAYAVQSLRQLTAILKELEELRAGR